MPDNIRNAQIITKAMIGGIIVLAASVAIVSFTNPVGIWLIINLFQMLMLLILTGAFIPETVRRYLSGLNFVFLNFDFIPFHRIPFISDFYQWMKFEQKNDNLRDIGIDFGSSITNNISFVILTLMLIVTHIPIALLSQIVF